MDYTVQQESEKTRQTNHKSISDVLKAQNITKEKTEEDKIFRVIFNNMKPLQFFCIEITRLFCIILRKCISRSNFIQIT